MAIDREFIASFEERYELEKFERITEAERELDGRTSVRWQVANGEERCGNKRVVERSGRVSRCSSSAEVLKLRTYDDGKVMPVAFLCDEHARERGYRGEVVG